MLGFGLEAHGSVVGTAGIVRFVIGARCVPSESDQDWCERTIYRRDDTPQPSSVVSGTVMILLTIVALKLQFLRDSVIHLLIVFPTPSHPNFPLRSRSHATSLGANLLGSVLSATICAEEVIGSSQCNGTDSGQDVRRERLSGRRRWWLLQEAGRIIEHAKASDKRKVRDTSVSPRYGTEMNGRLYIRLWFRHSRIHV